MVFPSQPPTLTQPNTSNRLLPEFNASPSWHQRPLPERNQYIPQHLTVVNQGRSDYSNNHPQSATSREIQNSLYQEPPQHPYIHVGYTDLPNTFNPLQHIHTVTEDPANPSIKSDRQFRPCNTTPSSTGDQPSASLPTTDIAYPRSPGLKAASLSKMAVDTEFRASHPPSTYYSSALSRPMKFPGQSSASMYDSISPGLPDDVGKLLTSFQIPSETKNSQMPSTQLSSHFSNQLPQVVNTHDTNNSVITHHTTTNTNTTIPPQPSIPMRTRTSSEWVNPTNFLQVDSLHERYTSPPINMDVHGQNPAMRENAFPNSMEQDSKPTARQSALCPLQTSVGTQRGAQSFPPSQIPDADLSFKNEEDAAGQLPKKKKKSKMHPCEICDKKFPRPSGLKTHMNTHNNARPYPCGYPGCTRTFGVRSNAKRHLRTHGVLQSPNEGNNEPPYVVGFSAPVLSNSYDSGQPGGYPGLDGEVPRHQMVKTFKLRWMPPSLNSRKNAALLKPVSEDGQFSDDDEDDDEDPHSLLVLSGSRHEGISLSSASSTSSSAGHASCVCSTPCSSTPCSSLIGANTALPAYRPSSLISIAAAVSSVRDTPYDGVSYGTSQYCGTAGIQPLPDAPVLVA